MSAQVFSSKLDIYSHFEWMLKDVTNKFNWISLDLLRQTTWGWSRDSDSDPDLNTWLLIFQRVRKDMNYNLKKLIEQHRRRLLSEPKMLKVESLRKISPRLEEKVAEGLRDNPNKKYLVERKVLDSDTPENRYMKHILFQTHEELNELIDRISTIDKISTVFKERLDEWSVDWAILKQHRFWNAIGKFHGLRKESLILSQDPIYANIRRSWFLLHQGLKFIDQELKGGIQNAAQLYEIWCLMKLDDLIRKEGWTCKQDKTNINIESSEDDFVKDEVKAGAIKFEYTKKNYEDVKLDLLFQPTANAHPEKNGIWSGMKATPVEQRPDIVLRLHRDDLPSQPVYTWIFDAKYRLNGNNAPNDAINQMHQYRDAILWSNQAAGTISKSLTRESIGAYVLYPGKEQDQNNFPQINSIDETNIGAFPLRPKDNDELPKHLSYKLKELLNIKFDYDGLMEQEKKYFAGVPSVKEENKGIIAVCATRKSMDKEYWKKCRLYRIPVKQAEKEAISPDQWNFIAPQEDNQPHFGLFPILDATEMNRREIKRIYKKHDIYISENPTYNERKYWLFKLADPITITSPLEDLEKGKTVKIDTI
jgi:predicted component of viral defense system (DUF524 family)